MQPAGRKLACRGLARSAHPPGARSDAGHREAPMQLGGGVRHRAGPRAQSTPARESLGS